MDRDDREGWKMIYDMLQASQKKDFVISDLERIMDDEKYIKEEIKEHLSENINTEIVEEKENKKKQFNIFESIFKGNKAKAEEGEDEYFEKLFEGYETKNAKLCLNEEVNSFYVNETQTDTVLLTEKSNRGRRLKDLNGDNDICISYVPFIIGKQERICDAVLDVEGVSRMHIQFFEQDGKLYAKDLNSRNGSCINGKQLENEENIRLNTGDIINICGRKFRLEME